MASTDNDLHGSDWIMVIVALVFLLPAGIYVLSGVISASPWESQGSASERQELVNSGVPIAVVETAQACLSTENEVSDRPELKRDTLPLDCPTYPVVVGERWAGTVVVGEVHTINGKWSGSDPHITLDELGRVSGLRTHTDSWGSLTNPSSGTEDVWIEARFPAPSADLLHQEIAGSAHLQLKVPEVSGASVFVDVTATRDRDFSLYIVTADELDLLAQTLPQSRWLALAIGAIGLVLTLIGVAAVYAVVSQGIRAVRRR